MNPLTDVFAVVESTQAALLTADQGQVNANAKVAAAQVAKAQADTDEVTAVNAANSAIDAAMAALQSAKRPVVTPAS